MGFLAIVDKSLKDFNFDVYCTNLYNNPSIYIKSNEKILLSYDDKFKYYDDRKNYKRKENLNLHNDISIYFNFDNKKFEVSKYYSSIGYKIYGKVDNKVQLSKLKEIISQKQKEKPELSISEITNDLSIIKSKDFKEIFEDKTKVVKKLNKLNLNLILNLPKIKEKEIDCYSK